MGFSVEQENQEEKFLLQGDVYQGMHSTDLKHCHCETGKILIWCQQKHDWCSVCFHACWWCYWIWNDNSLTIQKRVLDRTCMLPSKMPKKYGTYKYSNISHPGTENYRSVIQLTVLRHTENEFEALEMFMKRNVNVGRSCNFQLVNAWPAKMMCDSLRCSCMKIDVECSAGCLCGGKCANACESSSS